MSGDNDSQNQVKPFYLTIGDIRVMNKNFDIRRITCHSYEKCIFCIRLVQEIRIYIKLNKFLLLQVLGEINRAFMYNFPWTKIGFHLLNRVINTSPNRLKNTMPDIIIKNL